jgi:hypothetical protein
MHTEAEARTEPMAHVQDAAACVLRARGPMSAMKLQKLCYYSYGYHLAWESRRLFPERFEAWANGPVCPEPAAVRHGSRSFARPWSLGCSPSGIRAHPGAAASVAGGMTGHGIDSAGSGSARRSRTRPWPGPLTASLSRNRPATASVPTRPQRDLRADQVHRKSCASSADLIRPSAPPSSTPGSQRQPGRRS